MKIFKLFFAILFTLFLSTFVYASENQKGKIDMHGGNSDSLTTNQGFSSTLGLGAQLNKKDEKKEDKNFMKIDKIEKIKKEDKKVNE